MEFKKAMQDIFDVGIDLSKKTFNKAKELGEIGIIQVEIKTIEHEIAKKIGAIGTIAYDHFTKEDTPLTKTDQNIPELIQKIEELKEKIKRKEEDINTLKKK